MRTGTIVKKVATTSVAPRARLKRPKKVGGTFEKKEKLVVSESVTFELRRKSSRNTNKVNYKDQLLSEGELEGEEKIICLTMKLIVRMMKVMNLVFESIIF